MDLETHATLGLDQPTPSQVNGRSNYDVRWAVDHADDTYTLCPEAHEDNAIPKGSYQRFREWRTNAASIYPDTVRDVALYLPADVAPDDAWNLLLCQDGAGYASPQGSVRATRVLDYLHHHGEIAPTAAVFINPGRPADMPAAPISPEYDAQALQRSLEYDTLSPRYGDFVLQEVLPFISRECGVEFTRAPARRIACGMSSGGICAFSLAWFHSQAFGRVLSHCGSYTNIRGGHNYPYLVRTTPQKDIRVFMQSGAQDAQTLFGDWPTANMAMAKALQYVGYDVRFEFGTGGHTLKHGGALFADSLRWLTTI